MDNTKLENRIITLETQMREHHHDGFLGGQVYIRNLWGLFETVSVVPTTIPKTTYDQIKFYSNATTYRLYMYDTVNNVWRYATLT